MLDALKFAFEILIVGALALPWLALLERIFPSKNTFGLHALMLAIPAQARNAVFIAMIISFGYLMGSSISRFSKDFFNDELWAPLPTEDLIRQGVYFDEFCSGPDVLTYTKWPDVPEHPFAPNGFCPGDITQPQTSDSTTKPASTKRKAEKEAATPPNRAVIEHKKAFLEAEYSDKEKLEKFNHAVNEVFDLQESELLLEGLDKVDRLKQYFDQITVLRGASLNFLIVFALCVFGSLGKLRAHWSGNRFLRLLPFLPPLGAIYYAIQSSLHHLGEARHIFYSDPPLAEIVWVILGVIGFAAILRADTVFPYLRTCLISGVIMAISFGGWWWTEVMYDTQIIHSLPELRKPGELSGAPVSLKKELGTPDQSATQPSPPKTASPSQPQPTEPALH